MVDDIVSGRVVIDKSVISIEVQAMKVIEHRDRLLATIPNDFIDRFNTTTRVFGEIGKSCQWGGGAALSSNPGYNEIPGIAFIVECLIYNQCSFTKSISTIVNRCYVVKAFVYCIFLSNNFKTWKFVDTKLVPPIRFVFPRQRGEQLYHSQTLEDIWGLNNKFCSPTPRSVWHRAHRRVIEQ